MEEGQEDLHKDFGEEKNSENLLLTITRTFVDVHQFFCRPCVDRKPLQDRLWRTDHLKGFYGEKTNKVFCDKKKSFARPYVEKAPLQVLP